MKRFLLGSAVILGLAAGSVYGVKAIADTAGPPGHPPGPWTQAWGGGRGFGPGFPPRPGGWRHHDKFSLFAKVSDKSLSPADVKIIATAILLEHGNHSWTVAGVAAQSDKSIHFSYATAHGDVVATFAVDPASGRIERVN